MKNKTPVFSIVSALLLLWQSIVFAQTLESLGGGLIGGAPEGHHLLLDSTGDNLYVGGRFQNAGNVEVYSIARWDGQNWHALDSGLHDDAGNVPEVWAMDWYKGDLYVSGDFYTPTAEGKRSHQVARWDGKDWHFLDWFRYDGPGGNTGSVRGFYVHNDELYVTGTFDTIGGIYSPLVARWDGMEMHDVGGGLTKFGNYNNTATCALFFNGELYVAGNINAKKKPSPEGNEIIRLTINGEWKDVGGGIPGDPWVNHLMVYEDELWVAGLFYRDWGCSSDNIMRWDGTQWLPVGTGVMHNVQDLIRFDNRMWACGQIYEIDGTPTPSKRLAVWDGQEWSSVPIDFNNSVPYEMEIFKGELIVCGGMPKVQGKVMNHIGRYNPTGVGIFEHAPSQQLQVWPNPFNDVLQIKATDGKSIRSLQVLNVFGQKVYEGQSPENGFLSLPEIPNGFYLLDIELSDGAIVRKQIIKQAVLSE